MDSVSIIIPAYNCEDYIKLCLDSIVNQTYKSLEVIIVDDGSTDETLSILENYKQKIPSLFKVYSIPNSGQGHARNYGIKQATGKYVLFVDSDDYLEPNMIEVLVQAAKNNDSTLVICAYSRVSPKGELLYTEMTTTSREIISINTSPWNKLFVREIWIENEVQFSEELWYEDLEAILEYLPYAKNISWIEQPLYNYVQRENSSINQFSPRVEDIFSVLDNVYKYYEKHEYLDNYKDELEYFFIMHLVFGHLSRCVLEKDKKQRKQYIKRTKIYLEAKFPNYSKNKYFRFSELKKSGFGMFMIKLVGINAFKFNLYSLFLDLYDFKLRLSPNIKRW